MCQSISWGGWGCDSSYVDGLELMLFKVSTRRGWRVGEIKVDIIRPEKNEIELEDLKEERKVLDRVVFN